MKEKKKRVPPLNVVKLVFSADAYPAVTGCHSEDSAGSRAGSLVPTPMPAWLTLGCLLNRCHAWEASRPLKHWSLTLPVSPPVAVTHNTPDPPLTHRHLQTCCHRAPEAGGQVRRKKCGAKRSQSFPIPSGFPHLVSREGLVFGWMLQLCLTFKLPSALGG